MYYREMESELRSMASCYPIVTITGPRQSGKTTLVKNTFPQKAYVNLEAPDIRALAKEDPRYFLAKYPDGVILDEIQQVPSLLSYLQVIVDEKKEFGRYILTGSHQVELHHVVSQSLAGRTALLFLLPLSLKELKLANIALNPDDYLVNGFFPRIYHDRLSPTKAYRNYLQTYIEKDLRELIHIKDLLQFQRFLKLCAGRIGQVLNMESLANDVGVSSHTVKHWLSVLEASYITKMIPPYFENFGKRIIKSPKLYFCDVGLASYLLEIESPSQMNRDPLRGNLFENLVVIEMMKLRLNQGLEPNLYYYRDSHKNEVDLIYKQGSQLVPIEIKSSQTFNPYYLKNLNFFKKLVNERMNKGFLIYSGDFEQSMKEFKLINFKNLADVFD